MKDIIWTIIILWVVYKIVDIFRNTSVKKSSSYTSFDSRNGQQKPEGSVTVEKNDKNGKTPKINSTDGEYIDYEEIK
jgi:hypothetical protein